MEKNSFEKDFEQKIKKEIKIEPRDQMPEGYHDLLAQQVATHIYAKGSGIAEDVRWALQAPSLERKCMAVARIQDKTAQCLYLYAVGETLGITRNRMEQMDAGVRTSAPSYQQHVEILTWGDVGAAGWLIDSAFNLVESTLCASSYGPYARNLVRICRENSFHPRLGYDILLKLCRGNSEQKTMAQEAVNRWWWRSLRFFDFCEDDERKLSWKITRFSKEELRRQFVDRIKPQADILGLSLPDTDLKWDNETSHFDFRQKDAVAVDEPELRDHDRDPEKQTLPAGEEEDKEWVLTAAAAYAEKHIYADAEPKPAASGITEKKNQHKKRSIWNSLFGKFS